MKKTNLVKIILVGDSTVEAHKGWGGHFVSKHLSQGTVAINLARSGRSSRSFREEGHWDVALGEMSAPGYEAIYVLIQFGHNDRSGGPLVKTELNSEYSANLAGFVQEVRARGAFPILVTPLSTRYFSAGKLLPTMAPWAIETSRVAQTLTVPLVDLYTRSAEFLSEIGPVAANNLATRPPPMDAQLAAQKGETCKTIPPTEIEPLIVSAAAGRLTLGFDYTHIGESGASIFSGLVADELGKVIPRLARRLIA